MQYQLPKFGNPNTAEGKKQSEITKIDIRPDKEETMEDIIFRILVVSIMRCPICRGFGFLDPRSGEPLLTIDDLKGFQRYIQAKKEISIDHWKGHSIKTRMRIQGDHISLDFRYWLDRWNPEDWEDWIYPEFMDFLGEVLDIASKNTTERMLASAPIERDFDRKTF